MYTDDQLLPISALQHLLFCPRQCALIHLERLWAENRLTVEGNQLHQRAHGGGHHTCGDVRTVRSLALQSKRLGLAGVADIVEFHQDDEAKCPRAFPIEYKRGKPKSHDADRVQLCAQAICLEEMLSIAVDHGALFYGKTRRREDVAIDADLRRKTEDIAAQLHAMMASGVTPHATRQRKCDTCSLLNLCLPDALGRSRDVAGYMRDAVHRALQITSTDAGD